jgi:hypothetical protein
MPAAKTLHREMHRVIGKVTDDIERFQFNTAIAAMMELTNAAYDYRKRVPAGTRDLRSCEEVAENLTLLLAPFTCPTWPRSCGGGRSATRNLSTGTPGRPTTHPQPRLTRSRWPSRSTARYSDDAVIAVALERSSRPSWSPASSSVWS